MQLCYKVILEEGWAFNWVHRVNRRYLIKTKLIIDWPIDVTSHCMSGPMTAYRCDITSVLAAQMACRPTNFCLVLLSAIPFLPPLW